GTFSAAGSSLGESPAHAVERDAFAREAARSSRSLPVSDISPPPAQAGRPLTLTTGQAKRSRVDRNGRGPTDHDATVPGDGAMHSPHPGVGPADLRQLARTEARGVEPAFEVQGDEPSVDGNRVEEWSAPRRLDGPGSGIDDSDRPVHVDHDHRSAVAARD